ncbi:MAG: thiamine-phosphate kinase [Henriciella sp.]
MNESGWIQTYIAPLVHAPGALSLRDDVALLTADGPTLVTMDTLVEAIHFLPVDPLDTVGQKLVRVNVSDVIAKGAAPVEALLSIAWPRQRPEPEFQALMAGIERDLAAFEIALIGGDLVGTDGPLTLTLTLTGRCLAGAPIRRTTAEPGHTLWISGEIGWGGLGLNAAKAGGDDGAAQRYRVPEIGGLAEARTVATHASASMDVSDGLLLDLKRLADASECGAVIDLGAIPLAVPTKQPHHIIAQCTSGDDYQILLSADPGDLVPGFTKIGALTESLGLSLTYQGQAVNAPSILGFEH